MKLRKILNVVLKVLGFAKEQGWIQQGKGENIPGPKTVVLLSVLLLGACAGIEIPNIPWPLPSPAVSPTPPPTTQPPASPVPSASPSVPVPSPSPEPSPSPSPVPSPSPTVPPTPAPCTTTTMQPGYGRVERANGPWFSYAPVQIVKDKSAGKSYERMYRWIDGPRGEKIKDDCSTPSEKIQWARKTTNWACPDSYPGKPASCTIDGQDAACPAYDAEWANGYCHSTGGDRQRTDRQSNHVDRDGRILHEPDLDGYTGITCPVALAPVVITTCPSPSPSPEPSSSPTPAPTAAPGAPALLPSGNYPVPAKGTCPSWFAEARSRVGIAVASRRPCNAKKAGDNCVVVNYHATEKSRKPWCEHSCYAKDGTYSLGFCRNECELWEAGGGGCQYPSTGRDEDPPSMWIAHPSWGNRWDRCDKRSADGECADGGDCRATHICHDRMDNRQGPTKAMACPAGVNPPASSNDPVPSGCSVVTVDP